MTPVESIMLYIKNGNLENGIVYKRFTIDGIKYMEQQAYGELAGALNRAYNCGVADGCNKKRLDNYFLEEYAQIEVIPDLDKFFKPGTGETEQLITMENKNSGAIYRNEKKEKETQPDYTGKCTLEGKEYNLSGWINKSKAGKNYLRLLFKEIQPVDLNATAVQGKATMPPMNNEQEQADDLPF